MLRLAKSGIKRLIARLGYELVPSRNGMTHASTNAFPPDFDANTIETIQRVQPFTMTSRERICALCQSVNYIVRQQIPGAIVECGVWKGGSMMAAALTLQRLRTTERDLYLLDTFQGMTKPGDVDRDLRKQSAAQLMSRADRKTSFVWGNANIDEVKRNMASVGYPASRIRYVVGDVTETIPEAAPEQIALLRLDTDWFESTDHELRHLYPRLVPGGVLIVDDYGHWQGARQAVDQYLEQHNIPLFLQRIDYTGRIAVKPCLWPIDRE